MAHLVTGYAGTEHITAADQGSFNAAFFGGGQFVMEVGNQFEASIIDNSTVRVLDGDILMKGRHIRIEPGNYEDMTIETGAAGTKRNDLIVMEYSKDTTTGIESAYLRVIRGSATEGTPTDPAYTDGDILSGASVNQMPLYRVVMEGVVLSDIECLFKTIPTYKTLAEQYEAEFKKACESHLDSLGVLDSMEEVTANTQENQLAGALALKEMHEKHITDLKEVNGKASQLTTSILDKALELSNGVYNFNLGGENHTDNSYLPQAIYRYSSASIYKRTTNSIVVILWGFRSSNTYFPPVINCYDTNGWIGWKTFATTEDIQETIENIKIGGTNLLINTNSTSAPFATAETYRGLVVRYRDNSEGTTYGDLGTQRLSDIEPNTQYTLSFYAKGSGDINTYFYPNVVASGYSNMSTSGALGDGSIRHTLTDNWTKYVITYTTKDTVEGDKDLIPVRVNVGAIAYVCGIKFEKGNKATDWSPAPTDLAKTKDIDNLSTLIGDKSYISSLGDGTVTSAISVVNGKINSLSNATAKKTWTKLIEQKASMPVAVSTWGDYSEFLIKYQLDNNIYDTAIVSKEDLENGLCVRLADTVNSHSCSVSVTNVSENIFAITNSDIAHTVFVFGR